MPRKAALLKSLVFVFRAATLGKTRSSTPGTGATSPTQLAGVLQLLLSGLPPSQTRVAGASRSSSASSRGRQGGRRVAFAWGRAAAAFRFRLRDENNMDRDLLLEKYHRSAQVTLFRPRTPTFGGESPPTRQCEKRPRIPQRILTFL